jgi:hypothetical protein
MNVHRTAEPAPDLVAPPYRLFGRVPLHRWGDALAWAEGRLSEPRRSTSEAGIGA